MAMPAMSAMVMSKSDSPINCFAICDAFCADDFSQADFSRSRCLSSEGQGGEVDAGDKQDEDCNAR